MKRINSSSQAIAKKTITRTRTLTLITLFSLLICAAPAGAQSRNFKQLGSSTGIAGKTEEARARHGQKAHPAYTYNYGILYNFCPAINYCPDGAYPQAGLILDAANNLYGTTNGGGYGGVVNSGIVARPGGTVFKIDSSGHESPLYAFSPANYFTDGLSPVAGVIQDSAGNLYGTTPYGGGGSNGPAAGTVFELDSAGVETVLYRFCPTGTCTDGDYPLAGLVQDASGNLYGTTAGGGSGTYGAGGTVFQLVPGNPWTENVLYSFCSLPGCTDGDYPSAGLVQDSFGNLYGTTQEGGEKKGLGAGYGGGEVFVLCAPGVSSADIPPCAAGLTSWTEYVLYSFCANYNCTDGRDPVAGLIQDSVGNLYGTTQDGGVNLYPGTVFVLCAPGVASGDIAQCPLNAPSWTEVVLYSFGSSPGDGYLPEAGVIRDSSGNLYGTTEFGGSSTQGNVFQLDSSGNLTVLHSFCTPNCSDGYNPTAGLVQDSHGNLFGTTEGGGAYTRGTVFELKVYCPLCLVVNPSELNWGAIILGEMGKAQYVKVTNSSTQAIEIGSIEITGADAAQFKLAKAKKGGCGSVIAPGATCLIGATFNPTQLGLQTGTITITDSATNSPQTVSLSGTGIQ